jgi:electron-transferring-flavoprotein dehydrogenase
MERETIEFDVLFVGGGPACLAGAIRLAQLAQEKGTELEIALIDKGAEIGAHAISGAVMNPQALTELIPDYMEKGCPIESTVRQDAFCLLTRDRSYRLPLTPRYMQNEGFQVVSLSRLTRWMADAAEAAGINIFPGFSGTEVLFDNDQQTVIGVRTGDKGLDKEGNPKANFEPGIDILAKVTVLGEGARGSLTKAIDQKLALSKGKLPQVYETGVKEVIKLPEDNFFKTSPYNDIHTLGYPLGMDIPGGGFIYEMSDNRVTLGFLLGLSYDIPNLDPYDEFIKFKQHPFVANIIKGGKVIESGARTVSTGGYYTIPEVAFNGGLIVGGGAGIQNTPALKGIHVSMKSGMLAAEAIGYAISRKQFDTVTLGRYADLLEKSWIKTEMFEGRNFAQALAKKGLIKWIHLGAQYLTKGKGVLDPMSVEADWKTLDTINNRAAEAYRAVDRSMYDGELCVDKLTGVYLSKTMHREDEPSHLVVHDTRLCVEECYIRYGSPCTKFCPGNVYEIETDENTLERRLKLNPSNCLHCKTCDIKDPYENITWRCPEGGEGPNYTVM